MHVHLYTPLINIDYCINFDTLLIPSIRRRRRRRLIDQLHPATGLNHHEFRYYSNWNIKYWFQFVSQQRLLNVVLGRGHEDDDMEDHFSPETDN